jgi:hypothetical protein
LVAIAVQRTSIEHGSWHGRPTLAQRFEFRGAGVSADKVAHLLVSAPMAGEGSVFGARRGREATSDGSRVLRDFSPAPGFHFDVELERVDHTIIVEFSQPGRSRPYLHGHLAWILEDLPDGAVLDEQINTERALELVDEPLSGTQPSLRRWLFFRAGHARVMRHVTANLAQLLDG